MSLKLKVGLATPIVSLAVRVTDVPVETLVEGEAQRLTFPLPQVVPLPRLDAPVVMTHAAVPLFEVSVTPIVEVIAPVESVATEKLPE